MKYISIPINKVKEENSLSVEYYLGTSNNSGLCLAEFCQVIRARGKTNSGLSLDTKAGNNGFLQLVSYGTDKSDARSHSKLLPKGCVGISKLRTYLRQVICFSDEVANELGSESALISSEFLVLQPKNCSAYELSLILLSDSIQLHLQECTAGGHHPRVSEELLLASRFDENDVEMAKEKATQFEQACVNYIKAQMILLKLLG